MKLHEIRYFCVLAETLNFHRAAEILHISQPPLTIAIRKLETELGVSLFERNRRKVSLTPAGEAALPAAREALALFATMQHEHTRANWAN
jgi:DNA-binding transcriptional LysR family regulator